jgi:hypothetical protein
MGVPDGKLFCAASGAAVQHLHPMRSAEFAAGNSGMHSHATAEQTAAACFAAAADSAQVTCTAAAAAAAPRCLQHGCLLPGAGPGLW